MPTAQPTAKRNPISAGKHLLCLISVEEKMQPSFDNPKEETLRWIWQFKSKSTDPETGDRYEYRHYTGPNYGHPKAGLTILLDQMCPDLTDDQKSNIDTDELLNTYYEAHFRHEKPDKAGDPPKPRLTMVAPYKKPAAGAKAKAEPEPETEDDEFLDDPFANAA